RRENGLPAVYRLGGGNFWYSYCASQLELFFVFWDFNTTNYPIQAMFRYFVFFLLVFATAQLSYSQGDNRRQSGNQESALGNIYVDEIGIRLITEGLYFESELDPDTYVLGPLDALSVSIQGSANLIFRGLTINPTGDITIPTIGGIRVSGLTLTEASATIRDAIQPVYANNDVVTTLDIPRNIVVHMLGDVPQPGVRFMPAFSRLNVMVMSLFAEEYSPFMMNNRPAMSQAGRMGAESQQVQGSFAEQDESPEQQQQTIDRIDKRNVGINYLRTYSLRNITILHSDSTETRADLLGYYFGGMLDRNPVLKSGDRVLMQYRNTNAPLISVSGAVQRPFNAEYFEGDTVQDLIQIAGGLTEFANPEAILVFESGNETPITRTLDDLSTMEVKANTRIVVTKNEDVRTENSSVWAAGEILNPGNYPIKDRTTTLRDLLDMAGGFTADALPQAAYINRKVGKTEQTELRSVRTDNRDLLSRTAPLYLDNLEYLALEQRTSLNIVHVNLRDDFTLDNTRLHSNDRLIIPRDQNTITVWGQVNNTGYFPFWPERNVDDYISMAGGPSLSADTERIYIIKAGTNVWFRPNETTLESGDMIFIDRIPVENIEILRRYELEMAQQRNNNLSLIFAGLGTISSIVTTVILLLNR
ncbi:MAG: SLBB domain-containing protein, partial [Balneolales bacterium]|nr:SLBB domain-containing protein [Balneolales bacterium]